ncbi:MAG TPA: hypothetical protein VJT82_03225 [Pyrinomonadaceae bacterium]|nr:hypothetical protein [Pyrinomonadaceae bacterium]
MSDEVREKKHYRDVREIERLVAGFESCAVPPAEFDHRAHLTVALWYVSQSPDEAAAADRMRAGLHRYTKHNNAEAVYNETVTLFWLKLVRHFLDNADAERSLAEHTYNLCETYADSKLVFEYYSREIVQTPEAKRSWVEPDLKPLDF